MDFWQRIDAALDRIESEQPDTFDKVKTILDAGGDPHGIGAKGPDASFFGGSGGDRSLFSALLAAGWHTIVRKASYYYVVRHTRTGELLTYIEGDVHRGNTMLGAEAPDESQREV